jgi:ABC-2 type transport system permease protein
MTSLRIFFIGGMTSYRALFNWLTPYILIPTFVAGPILQIIFFAFVGRAAGVGDDEFYLIGNSVQYAAIPCLFAMGFAIGNERYFQTLGLLLASPARRIPLFLGRAMPVILNGFLVSVVALFGGALILRVSLPLDALLPLVLVVMVASFSCTGLGLVMAAMSLRVRETAVLANVLFGTLLIFCGVNVPLSSMPSWMQSVAAWLPMTHSISAARGLAASASWSTVLPAVRAEVVIGLMYLAIGMAMLRWLERESRRHATLEIA